MLEKQITRKFVMSFLDIIVMTMLNNTPMYGYGIMAMIHKEFGVLLSPGTLYPLLHSLEEKKLIKANRSEGKIVYQATLSGRQKFKGTLTTFTRMVEKISNFVKERSKEIILPA